MARPPNAWGPAIGEPVENRLMRELVTPEGVDLRVQLAEASERAAAFLLDAAIIIGVLAALTLVLIMAIIGAAGAGLVASDKNVVSVQVIGVVWLLGAFLVRNGYFILFELTPRAATPGKRVLGLRVAARSGGRLTADAIFARNAMRELEIFLPLTFLLSQGGQVDAWLNLIGIIWCALFVFFPLFNRDRLRVGDLVAGTWVVKAPQRKLMADVAETALAGRVAFAGIGEDFAFTQAQVDAYGAKELHVLEDVLRRTEARTIAAVAERIRTKIGWTRGANESDYAFLDAYYLALRARLESRLLFGRRRRDKFDSP
ncbi:MAG TPA: RDD family protein [Caulobacteraceae bacterium]|nr:RDD family protein [Caulobacteraceae bacterium]